MMIFMLILKKNYGLLIASSFENDIIKSTGDIITACIDNNLSLQKVKLNDYFKGINASKYVDLPRLYNDIFEKLITKENRFLLFDMLNKTPELEKVRCSYGKILRDNYKQSDNIENQKLILEEIDTLIAQVESKKI